MKRVQEPNEVHLPSTQTWPDRLHSQRTTALKGKPQKMHNLCKLKVCERLAAQLQTSASQHRCCNPVLWHCFVRNIGLHSGESFVESWKCSPCLPTTKTDPLPQQGAYRFRKELIGCSWCLPLQHCDNLFLQVQLQSKCAIAVLALLEHNIWHPNTLKSLALVSKGHGPKIPVISSITWPSSGDNRGHEIVCWASNKD